MLALYAAAIFLGAALLFAVEPLAAKHALPLFGGSPAVWNTCVMFFQVQLLAAYLYAHALTTRLRPGAQLAVHAAVLAAAAAVPVGIRAGAVEPGAGIGGLLLLLLGGVGAQFFAVASAGPLLQRWFARTDHRAADDPYFLYGASNAGSFVGLLAYPFLIERVWSLGEQAAWWRGGFLAFVALTITAGAVALRRTRATGPARSPAGADAPSASPARPEAAPGGDRSPRPWRRRSRWIFLAFVPSSLLLGVTHYISTDVASAPLLWVIPLGIYLLTFIVAFSRAGESVTRVSARLWPIITAAVVLAFLMHARQPLVPIVVLHLCVLGVAGALCNGRLHASRPEVAGLTDFYVCIALGGALGGVFNSLLAPAIFNDLYEYPLVIGLAALALPEPRAPLRAAKRLLWLAPAALGAWVLLSAARPPRTGADEIDLLLVAGLPALGLYVTSRRPAVFAAGTLAVLGAGELAPSSAVHEHQERTFFGIYSVRVDPQRGLRVLSHGTTVHGIESLDPDLRSEPLAYYTRPGPAGSAFAAVGERLRRVACIGLGAGSLAAYGRPGQEFDFFEIDPAVVRIASNAEWFTFLSESEARTRFVIGDGRLTLAREPDASYDMIVLDAFSSDAIPTHLLTREAVELYARKLAPDGLLLLHLSNRHLGLAPLAAAACRAAGLAAWVRNDPQAIEDQTASGRFGSEWMLAARPGAPLGAIARDPRWVAAQPAPRPWTDDHADLVGALRRE
ncbi:MAG TPA: fused MFS/spermidine synthase [Phycisphaerales bacterium]|nr:fused MFS/spermidine synthase [Phycisphaerales bacterium]